VKPFARAAYGDVNVVELVHEADWPTRASARSAIFEYLEGFYNRRRRHSSIGCVSPEEFELTYEEQKMAA
jgi:transposase InsO family protein